MNQSFIRLSSPASSSFAGITRAVIARQAGFVIAAIGRSSFACVAFAAFAANATPRIPYANDFSTRTSGATPSDRWMESPYIPGALARVDPGVDGAAESGFSQGVHEPRAALLAPVGPVGLADEGE